MANVEHLALLLSGVERWNKWRQEEPSTEPDLTLSELINVNLERVNLAHTKLDGATLRGSILRDAILEGASARQVDFSGADLSRALLDNALLEGANFSGSCLERCQSTSACFDRAELHYTQLSSGIFCRASFTQASIEDCVCEECQFDGSTWSDAEISRTSFRKSRLDQATLKRAKVVASDFSQASIVGGDFEEASMSECDLSGSCLRAVRIVRCGFSNNVYKDVDLSGSLLVSFDFGANLLGDGLLFDAQVRSPIWNFRCVRVGILGMPLFHPHLFEHPVADIRGLEPRLRREIADAQYLRSVKEQGSGNFRGLLLRLWGLTANFGQSLMRFCVASAILVVGLAGILRFGQYYPPNDLEGRDQPRVVTAAAKSKDNKGQIPAKKVMINDTQTSQRRSRSLSFSEALLASFEIFMGFGAGGMQPANQAARTIVSLGRVMGFVVLAALVAILANRFVRLS